MDTYDINCAERILEFFNNVSTADEIASRIYDDPNYGASSGEAYGMSSGVAEEILAVRNGLPGQKFSTLQQIEGIEGVGTDTFHDILYSFQRVDFPQHQWDDTKLRFQNTNSTWGEFHDLKGDQGPQGGPGPQGTQGPTGMTGSKGLTGPTGPGGPQGTRGPQGEKGEKGDPGDITSGITGNLGVGTETADAKLHIKAPNDDWACGIRLEDDRTSNYYDLIHDYKFRIGYNSATLLVVDPDGKVGIGTSNPESKLAVKGKITAEEIQVKSPVADHVFKDDYELQPLPELETYIQENKHLPNIPSGKDVAGKGVKLGEMQAKLLEKIEELTLHVIGLKKENDVLTQRISVLEGSSL